MTEEKINKIKRELKWHDNDEALSLIDSLEKENEKLKKDNEAYEQTFWDNNNEIARLKRKIDKMKRGVKNGTV